MHEWLLQYGYLSMFLLAFLASTALPLASEWLLVALVIKGLNPTLLLVCAVSGNYLGACTTYCIGYYGSDFAIRKILKIRDESRAKAYIYTYQTDASTIKRDTPEYANNYDHFSFDERTRRIVRMDSIHSIDLVNKYTKSEDVTQEQRFDRYRKEISDHLPIMMEVDL